MSFPTRTVSYVALAGLIAAVLWITADYNYLLFHSVVEIAGVVVAAAMFSVAWNTRHLGTNGYLTFLGIAYLFVGLLDLFHALSYKGMGVFPGRGADLPTQLWIAARGLEAASLLVSPLYLRRPAPGWRTLSVYAAVSVSLLVLIVRFGAFPTCYVETGPDPGLTPFKINAEYVICATLAAASFLAWRMRERFSPTVLRLVLWALGATVLSELAFTQYVSVYGDSNKVGHLLKVTSFALVFSATVLASLRDPYHVLFRDLQRREEEARRAQQQLEENAVRLAAANRTKDDFLATLSHELRTPLHAILGWSDLLLRGGLDEQGARRGLNIIARNAKAQAALVNDVLDVSRIITGKLRLDLRRTDVADVVRAALEAVKPAAANKDIEMTPVAMESAAVLGDADRLQQVIWNLLSNAVKFTPPGGRIEVSVRRHEAEVEIEVRDTGTGLAPDAIPHLFERFWQADASSARQHRGLGLGLAIVRHLVELHGGRVWATSAGPNLGSTFTVAIPIRAVERSARPSAGGQAAGDEAGDPDAGSLAGLRVVIVDDEADARELLSAVIEGMGGTAWTAASAADGLDAVRRHRPDVVLSDIGMPREDGYAFIAALRAMRPQEGGRMPAIAITAYGRPDDERRALGSGFDAHIKKPASREEIASAIRRLLSPEGASKR